MADSNPQRRAEANEFLDDDPFAELTRIMGHDPRTEEKPEAAPAMTQPEARPVPVAATASAPAAEDQVEAVDLEQELFSELDFSEFDTPEEEFDTAEEPADWRNTEAAPASIAEQPVARTYEPSTPIAASDPVVDESVEFDLDLEMTGWEDEAELVGSEHAQDREPATEPMVETATHAADDVVADFDLELEMTGWEADPEPVLAESVATTSPAPAFETEPMASAQSSQWQDDAAGTDIADTFDLDDDLGESLERELFSASLDDLEDHAPAMAAAAPVHFESASAPFETDSHQQAMAVDGRTAEDEPDFDQLLDVELEDDAQITDHAAGADRWAADDSVHLSADASEEPKPSSLEDELNMLLASHGFGSGNAGAAKAFESPAAAPAEPHAAAPAANGYGLANYAERNHPTGSHDVPGLDAPVATLDDDDMVDIFGDDLRPAPEPEPTQWTQPVATAAATVAGSAFVGSSAYAAGSTAPSWKSDGAPDIETVDIADSAKVLTDDLEIPDLDFGDVSTSASIYDELDGEFAQAMDDLSFEDQQAPSGAGQVPVKAAQSVMPAASYEEPRQDGHWEQPDVHWQGEAALADDPLDFDSELESAITMAAYDEPESQARPHRRRGMVVAGLVAGVAVIGGLGVFGMSFFGAGSDSPAVIRADADPMKVRPENPGGTTVPNQDSEAYQRVAGGATDAEPEQRELISSTEEPVDLAARGAEAEQALPPAISDDAVEAETALAPAAQPKSEERVAATEETAPETVEDLLVTPRRVRTMIVRPDGTLVAREDAPAPAVEANETTSSAPSVAAAIPSLAPAGQPLPGEQAADDQALATVEDAGPVVETPDTVSVVPSQRREPTAASQPAQVAAAQVQPPRPVVQQPATAAPIAATPASAPAAAAPSGAGASEWSMQIASQPTADSAQATYQDLARRYGGVLEGRGVNIVRADIAGKGTYFRVRIPASSRDEAIQLCTRYKSAGGSCFVSR